MFIVGLLFFDIPVSEAQSTTAPILVLHNPTGDGIYGEYIGEILKAEGITVFDLIDISIFDIGLLPQYKVVILAQSLLNSSQASALTTYVNNGGHVVAMRPDPQLGAIFGLSSPAGTQTDGYLAINTTASMDGTSPGAGLVTETLQIHGTVDRYSLAGNAVTLARLYSDATTETTYPAVVGAVHGAGRGVAFLYDLPTNIIFMRQGNPNNATYVHPQTGYTGDVNGDGIFRTIDLFERIGGGAPWVDLNRVPIPQADMQQRFFARLVKQLVERVQPVPQMWYFPGMAKTMLILTGDAHENPLDWYETEINSINAHGGKITLYLATHYPFLPYDESVQPWRAQGHEIGIHPPVRQLYDIHNLGEGYQIYDNTFSGMYSSPKSRTVRNHQIAWEGWTAAAEISASYGIRLDTNFYHWGEWLHKGDGSWAHGYITGSGLPMKFVKDDGTILPVYQQLTQLVDEQFIDEVPDDGYVNENLTGLQALSISEDIMNASLGGYYSALMAQFHVDYYVKNEPRVWAEGVMDYANNHGVPIWNADQWLNFTELRYESKYSNIIWDTQTGNLTFDLNASTKPEMLLTTILPITYDGGALRFIKVDGIAVAYQQTDVNGVMMAFVSVPAGNHSFTVHYYSTADLSITKIGDSDPVIAGESLLYTIVVSNAGPDSAMSVEVHDSLPAGFNLTSAEPTQGTCSGSATINCSVGTIATGGSVSITVTGTVNPAQRGELINTAQVAAQSKDDNLTNNSATVTTTITPSANISLSMVDAQDPVLAGTELTYNMAVSNAGPSTASSVSVALSLPSGVSYGSRIGTGWTCTPISEAVTCSLSGSIGAGEISNLQVKVLVPAAQVNNLSSTASVSAFESDPNTADNTVTEATDVARRADVALDVTGAPARVIPGTDLVYTLAVSNLGPNTADSLTARVTLPLNSTFVDAVGPGWTCVESTGIVTCTLTQLKVGLANPVVIRLIAPPTVNPIIVIADIDSTTIDPELSNNSVILTTNLNYVEFLPAISNIH